MRSSFACQVCKGSGKCQLCNGAGCNFEGYGHHAKRNGCKSCGGSGTYHDYWYDATPQTGYEKGTGKCHFCGGSGDFTMAAKPIVVTLAKTQGGVQAANMSGEIAGEYDYGQTILHIRSDLQGTFGHAGVVQLVSAHGVLLDHLFDGLSFNDSDLERMQTAAPTLRALMSADTLVSFEIEEFKAAIQTAKRLERYDTFFNVAKFEIKLGELQRTWASFTKPCTDIEAVQDESVLLQYCKVAQVRWVRVAYLFELEGGTKPFPRNQDIPEDMFCTLAEVEDWFRISYPLVISYVWHTAPHPDPSCISLQQICEFVQNCKHYSGLDRSKCPVLLDFLSLYQRPRTPKENEIFITLQLPNINLFYRHDKTLVLRLNGEIPQHSSIENRVPFYERGWCNMEHRVSEMKNDRTLSVSFQEWRSKQDARYFDVMPPNEFDKELQTFRFTCGREDRPRVSALYRNTYNLCAGYNVDLGLCPNNHELGFFRTTDQNAVGDCTTCKKPTTAHRMVLCCWTCDFRFCEACMSENHAKMLGHVLDVIRPSPPPSPKASVEAQLVQQIPERIPTAPACGNIDVRTRSHNYYRMEGGDKVPISDAKKQFILNRLNPMLEDMVAEAIVKMPPNPVPFMLDFFEAKRVAEEDKLLSPAEQERLKQENDVLRATMTKVKNKLQEAAKLVSKEGTDEEEEEEEDDIEEPPDFYKTEAQMNKVRSSVSAEAYGEWNKKKEFVAPVISKNDEQEVRLKACLSKSFLFENLESQDMSIVIGAMKEVRVQAKRRVINQGDSGDFLFVIEAGTLDCVVNVDGADRVVKTCEAGDVFGELALLYNCPRAASVDSRVDCVLWQLDRDTFNSIVKEAAQKKRDRYNTFLGKVPLLASMDAYERSQLADALKIRDFPDGAAICKEGEQGNKFYIVEEGEAVAAKAGKMVYKYVSGDYFGELALIRNQPRAATVTAQGNAKLLSIDSRTFKRLLNVSDLLERSAKYA